MKFIYQARSRTGEVRSGSVVAPSQNKAEQLLADNDLILIAIKPETENWWAKLNMFGRKVSYKELVLFSRQLATLINAKVPILQSLRILQAQVDSPALLAILRDTVASVEAGESFSNALARHPELFGNIYVSLVRSGEAAGSVGQSLLYLADQLEKDYELRSRVRSALTYPGFVMLALVVVGVLMFKFVLPKLTVVLEEQGGSLPFVSVLLIKFTHFFDQFWWLVLLVFFGAIFAVRAYIKSVPGRYVWDRYKTKIPIIGDIFQKIYMSRFSRNLATLIAGGLPIIQALKIVSEVLNNVIYRDILTEAAAQVTNGKSLSESLQRHDEFPALVTQMVQVGEQTAQLDNILLKLAIFYEKDVDTKVATLATLLEPIVMVILGLGVGVLIAGILLPIYNLASTIS